MFNANIVNSPDCSFDLEIHENDYYPYKIKNAQKYNPLYSLFIDKTKLDAIEINKIALNHKYHVVDLENVVNIENDETIEKSVFVKFSPLLDPIRYLIGKYNSNTHTDCLKILPNIDSTNNNYHPKLLKTNNASYIDNYFCYLSSQLLNTHNFKNCIDFYGSVLGIQEKYKINVIDDMEYLNQSEHFLNSRNEVYEIDEVDDPFANFGSRRNRNKIEIHNNSSTMSELSVEDLEIDSENVHEGDIVEISDETLASDALLYEKLNDNSNNSSDDDSSNNSEINYTSDEN